MKTTKLIRVNIVFAISFCTVFILMVSSCKELYPITKTAEGYTFEIDENQNATLIKTDILAETIEIPLEISSYDVKKLGGDRVIGGILFSMTYDGLFEGNSTVKEIIIPEGVEIVGDQAIDSCENLEKIALPNTLAELQIINCDKLEKVDIPGSVTSLSLLGCDNLKEINFTDSDMIINDFCFEGSGLESILLPNRLEKIPELAFSGCVQLETVNIPQSVTSINYSAFEWCTSLVSLELPGNIERIEECAFRECSSVEKIIIYDKVDYIADNAFNGCDKLTIYGIKGSYVEQYANEHNIPFGELDTTYEPTN